MKETKIRNQLFTPDDGDTELKTIQWHLSIDGNSATLYVTTTAVDFLIGVLRVRGDGVVEMLRIADEDNPGLPLDGDNFVEIDYVPE